MAEPPPAKRVRRETERESSDGPPLFSLVACGKATYAATRRRGRAKGAGSEDRFSVERLPSDTGALSVDDANHARWFAAVFDGHGGAEAAEKAAATMHVHLAAEIASAPGGESSLVDAVSSAEATSDGPGASLASSAADVEASVSASMARVFRKTDDDVLEDDIDCGSTACTVLVGRRGFVVANAGDSRAVMCKKKASDVGALGNAATNGDGGGEAAASAAAGASGAPSTPTDVGGARKISGDWTDGALPPDNAVAAAAAADAGIEAVRLSTDHTPNLRGERERIERSGGMVLTLGGAARVCCESSPCMLAVSRALGDRSLKFGGSVSRGLVTEEPECTLRRCDGTELLLVLASDGVTDVVDDETSAITALAAARVAGAAGAATAEEAADAAAEAVVRLSVERGSPDDITAVVVLLSHDAWRPAAAASAAADAAAADVAAVNAASDAPARTAVAGGRSSSPTAPSGDKADE